MYKAGLRFAAGLVLFVLLAAGCLLTWSFVAPSSEPPKGSVLVRVPPNADRWAVVEELAQHELVSSPALMKAYVSTLGFSARFVPRDHFLRRGSSPRQLVTQLAQLRARPRVEVTLVEGWTHLQVAQALHEAGVCPRLSFESAVFDRALLDALAIAAPSAEGYLFPARYPFSVDSDAKSVLRRLSNETRKRLGRLSGDPHPDLERLRFGEHEVLTLASIVEKETAREQERPRIARVFLNRLLRPRAGTSGRLQSDPTALYGCLVDPLSAPSCASPAKGATVAMLRDPGNPYNTYRHAGLPPGPISNPGDRALEAVLHPAAGDELFFVADGEGGHVFSSTFEAHKQAIEALRRKRGALP